LHHQIHNVHYLIEGRRYEKVAINRHSLRIKADGFDPNKIKKACDFIFRYLSEEEFCLLEMEHVMSSMGLILSDMLKDDPLRKIAEFGYSSSVDSVFSCKVASNTKS
jgi:hypothetical protein